ncbi:hypothetical protein ACP70R_033687 [Stipagrostis hirtigluma subsp. patula]
MGFEKMVLKAMKENGHGDAESLLQLLLTYQAIGSDPSVDNTCASGSVPQHVDDSDDDGILENWDDEDASGSNNRGPNSDDSSDEDFLQEMSQKDKKVESLVKMGLLESKSDRRKWNQYVPSLTG